MSNYTKQVFDVTASTYDADRTRLIPGGDTFYRWALDLISKDVQHVIELGAGSGLMTVLLRQRFPGARIHLIDFSGAMLAIARNRLGSDPLTTYEEADYVQAPFRSNVDAIVSSLSIHHLDHPEKKIVFRKAYDALRKGGVFVNAEQVAGPTPELDARSKAIWLEQVHANGVTHDKIEGSLHRQKEDRCASVEDQLRWMREAGFSDADCWYKENRFAVLAGTR